MVSPSDGYNKNRDLHGSNKLSVETIKHSADICRPVIIDTVFKGFLAYLTYQIEYLEKVTKTENTPLAPIGITVTLSIGKLPFVNGAAQDALCLELMPDIGLGQERLGKEKMLLFMPVPNGFWVEPELDLNVLTRPEYIMVELHDQKGRSKSYIVRDESIEPYDEELDAVGDDAIALQGIGSYVTSRVSPSDKAAIDILTKLTDWTVQVQRTITTEE